jgi:aminoglycoside 3-N-acetyltransferase
MNEVTRGKIIEDFRNLGVRPGDVIFITSDLFSVGFFVKSKKDTLNEWVNILLEVVGDKGCVIMASYTDTFFRFKKNKNIVFNKYTRTSVGPLASFLIDHPASARSTHPTSSCIGIGHNVDKILESHTEDSLSYSVLGTIIDQGGKFILIGTLDTKNAPQAMHYVQEVLGYTKQSPFKGLFQTYYVDKEGNSRIFTRYDHGGCSRGGYHLYGNLIINNAIEFGYIGNAFSALMDGKKSFDVIMDALKKDRSIVKCDDRYCTSCFGNIYMNGFGVFPFYFRKAINYLKHQ